MKHSIEIHDLGKEISEVTILRDVSLRLEQGRIYGFVGKNGSGKTMLFRMIAGLVKPTSGEILYDGKTVAYGKKIPLDMGIMIENAGLYPEMSAFENLRFLASLRNRTSNEQIKNVIQKVGLNPADKRKIKKYSLGMRQRLIFAQSIMEEPDLLLLDEPTNALDTDGVALIREMIREEKERGAIICIASHNKEDIDSLCDEIYSVKEETITIQKNDWEETKDA